MAYRWTFAKDSLKLEEILWAIHHGAATTDLQIKFFIEPAESCPHLLKATLWKELAPLVKWCRITIWKTFFLICSQTLLFIISDMRVTDHRHYDRLHRKQNRELRLQECFLKNRSFRKLVILLEKYIKQRQ